MKIDKNAPFKMMVCGFNGSGKTTFIKDLIKKLALPTLIYDWHDEYGSMEGKNIFVYVPQHRNTPEDRRAEFDSVIKKLFINPRKLRLLVVDEINEYCPNGLPLPDCMNDLNANHRHYGTIGNEKGGQSIIGIARRPVDVATSLIEIAHYRIFFKLFGKNDLQYLDNLKAGLSDKMEALPEWHYILLNHKGEQAIMKPVNP